MILLTDEEIDKEHNNWCRRRGKEDLKMSWRQWMVKAQLKRTLISVGKESTRLDGTIYLVPDYVEYRKALKGVGLE